MGLGLSQALADHAAEVAGVDIAESMVATARSHNRHGRRVRYLVNTSPDPGLLEDASFDFVYSNITLQHIPHRYGRVYIREFFRIVGPGGCVLFQMRGGPNRAGYAESAPVPPESGAFAPPGAASGLPATSNG